MAGCEIKTKIASSGLNVKSTFTKAEKDGSLSGVIELKQNVRGVDCTGKIDTKSQLNLVFEHGDLIPGLKLKGEGALSGSTSKITADYKHDKVMATASIDTVKSVIGINSVFGFNAFNAGFSSNYTYKGKDGKAVWSSPAFAAQYDGGDYQVGASCKDMGGSLGVAVHKTISKETSVAVSIEQATKNKNTSLDVALGASYKVDKDASLKGKVDSKGVISLLYSQKLKSNTTLKVSGEINSSKLSAANAHKFGLAALMEY
ncbi:eukaryotic porin/Tom40 [Baffinella frigidus]|nr:eukaryotic porin/Tom40 [Cryptophyta sp. CCMP2293]